MSNEEVLTPVILNFKINHPFVLTLISIEGVTTLVESFMLDADLTSLSFSTPDDFGRFLLDEAIAHNKGSSSDQSLTHCRNSTRLRRSGKIGSIQTIVEVNSNLLYFEYCTKIWKYLTVIKFINPGSEEEYFHWIIQRGLYPRARIIFWKY